MMNIPNNPTDDKIKEILAKWKAETKHSLPCYYTLAEGMLTIYTSSPGPFIGFLGERVHRYKKLLIKEIPRILDVQFEEVDNCWF